MKKLSSYLFLLLSVLFMGSLTSCSEKEDELTELTSEQIAQYSQDIVGKWKVDGTQEYWRFDAQGGGSVGYGENWDQADDIFEGDEGTYKFQWYFKPSGLYIIIRINGEYGNPDTECPYAILSLTSSKLTWKTNQGRQVSMTKQ